MMSSSPRPDPQQSVRSDWWQLGIQIKILDLIYTCVRTLGVESDLLNPASFERLLTHRQIDTAIRLAYKLRLPKSQGDSVTAGYSSADWNDDKRKILECLVPIHRDRPLYDPVDVDEIKQFARHKASSTDPWSAPEQRIPQAYHTPKTPALVRAPSNTRSPSVQSDHAPVADDRHERGSEPVFSPADSNSSGSRRRRSSSSMPNDKPGKRARGPQEHTCAVCRKTFPFLSKLNDHMKTHSTEKGLRCYLCRKSFKRTREVNAHLKSVHKIDVLQVPPPHPPPTLGPPTPASLPTPGAMHPPTPGPSSSLPPPPRPSPRLMLYYTPTPTPEQFNEPTPAETEQDYRETPPVFTPGITAVEGDRRRESSYRGGNEENPKLAERVNLVDRVERFDISDDIGPGALKPSEPFDPALKLAPILNPIQSIPPAVPPGDDDSEVSRPTSDSPDGKASDGAPNETDVRGNSRSSPSEVDEKELSPSILKYEKAVLFGESPSRHLNWREMEG